VFAASGGGGTRNSRTEEMTQVLHEPACGSVIPLWSARAGGITETNRTIRHRRICIGFHPFRLFGTAGSKPGTLNAIRAVRILRATKVL
jgi:hypothetical protein